MEEIKKVIACRVMQAGGSERVQLCELVTIKGRPHALLGGQAYALNPSQISPAQGAPDMDYTYQGVLVPPRLTH